MTGPPSVSESESARSNVIMRLRAGHVTIAAIVLVTLFVVAATWMGSSGPGGGEAVEGALPPEGSAPDQVAVMAVDATEVDLGVIPNTGEGHGKLVVHNRGRGRSRSTRSVPVAPALPGSLRPAHCPFPQAVRRN